MIIIKKLRTKFSFDFFIKVNLNIKNYMIIIKKLRTKFSFDFLKNIY